jgi:predicted GIY-YIG superfamily endonuclease
MHYVYIIGSTSHPRQRYVGYTGVKLDLRLARHNDGTTPATSRCRPWRLLWAAGFTDKHTAIEFEAYLKSGSGRAFAAKRLLAASAEALA